MTYTIKRITSENALAKDLEFIANGSQNSNLLYGKNYEWCKKWSSGHFWSFVDKHFLIVCYRDEQPVGFLAASLYQSFFDSSTILQQNILYALPSTRAAYLLLKEFVDFGRSNANHVITMIAKHSNIRPGSLERMGFCKLEELYRLED